MGLLSYSAWKVVINATRPTLANNAKPKVITSQTSTLSIISVWNAWWTVRLVRIRLHAQVVLMDLHLIQLLKHVNSVLITSVWLAHQQIWRIARNAWICIFCPMENALHALKAVKTVVQIQLAHNVILVICSLQQHPKINVQDAHKVVQNVPKLFVYSVTQVISIPQEPAQNVSKTVGVVLLQLIA